MLWIARSQLSKSPIEGIAACISVKGSLRVVEDSGSFAPLHHRLYIKPHLTRALRRWSMYEIAI